MKVKIDGVGVFDVTEECLPKLLEILNRNLATKIRENDDSCTSFGGRELLNG